MHSTITNEMQLIWLTFSAVYFYWIILYLSAFAAKLVLKCIIVYCLDSNMLKINSLVAWCWLVLLGYMIVFIAILYY